MHAEVAPLTTQVCWIAEQTFPLINSTSTEAPGPRVSACRLGSATEDGAGSRQLTATQVLLSAPAVVPS